MIKKIITTLTAAGAVLSLTGMVYAATQSITPSDMMGWGFVEETPTGTGDMVTGPDTPPMGVGSAHFVVDDTGGELLAKAGYAGTRLDEITGLEYSTYRTSGADALAVSLQFNVDDDLNDADDSWKGRLVFEPYYTETVNTGEWQTWDPMTQGKWWGTGATVAAECSMASPCTWNEVLAAFPDAGIHQVYEAVGLKAGGSWAGGFDGNADALTIEVNSVADTYDFEPDVEPSTPTSKDECKDDGWMTFSDPEFKNQGQCVAYVVSSPNSAHHH